MENPDELMAEVLRLTAEQFKLIRALAARQEAELDAATNSEEERWNIVKRYGVLLREESARHRQEISVLVRRIEQCKD